MVSRRLSVSSGGLPHSPPASPRLRHPVAGHPGPDDAWIWRGSLVLTTHLPARLDPTCTEASVENGFTAGNSLSLNNQPAPDTGCLGVEREEQGNERHSRLESSLDHFGRRLRDAPIPAYDHRHLPTFSRTTTTHVNRLDASISNDTS